MIEKNKYVLQLVIPPCHYRHVRNEIVIDISLDTPKMSNATEALRDWPYVSIG